jgi:ElaB/YqjD/DUF883 family membrane-anchored ribosome-binding protein
MNLDTAFRSIYGRDPSPEETNQFNRISKELDIRDNDAIWAITFLLGHHLDLAKQMPEQIDKLISQSLAKYATSLTSARRLAETDLAATKARIEETVGQAVVTSAQREIARAAQTVAQSTARKSWLQWLGSAAVVGMLLIGGTFYWGYAIGNTNGYARSLDVKAVSAWAASSEGQAAYKLDQDGDLRSLIRCDRDGWTVQRSQDGKHKLCIVRPAGDGFVSGWYVP